MPELPEVTYFKKYVDATVLHKKIRELNIAGGKIFQATEKEFKEALLDNQFIESQRHGKYLFLKVSKGNYLVFHFGMSGDLEYAQQGQPPAHTHFTVVFTDNSKLFFSCPRKFGKIFLAKNIAQFKKEHDLGPDALEISFDDFVHLVTTKRGSIKSVLMDQKNIAGMGNMYVDEVLLQTGIHPETPANTIEGGKVKIMYKQMDEVLRTVIRSQTEDTPLPKNYLTRNRKAGSPCPTCTGKLKKIKVAGRSTYFCPACQKLS